MTYFEKQENYGKDSKTEFIHFLRNMDDLKVKMKYLNFKNGNLFSFHPLNN